MNKAILFIAAGAAVVLVLVLIDRKGGAGGLAFSAAQAAGTAAVDTAAGVVVGIGEAVGVPQTNMTECERAIAEGRTWDASFACPAGTFLKHLVS